MTEEERQYREQITWLEKQLEGVGRDLDRVAERLGNGAILKYPFEHKDAEMSAAHERLSRKTDEILDRIQKLRKEHFDRTA